MRDLSPADIKAGMVDGKIMLIDVREPHEFSEARISGAFNFPLSTFDPLAMPVTGDRQIVFHCGTGKRSGMALDQCQQEGVAVTSHMAGGIQAWRKDGLKVIAVDPSTGQLKEI